MNLRILVNYDGQSDDCIKAAFIYFGDRLNDLYIHTAVPHLPYCSALETFFYDPSYAEEKYQEYYQQKSSDKQKECAMNYPKVSVETILSRGSYGLNILSTCKEKDPDLLILCRSNKSFNMFGSGDDWGIVRTRCYKPILELKKGD